MPPVNSFGGGIGTSPITEMKLRCGDCGAPYAGTPSGEILTCSYCGSSQRMVDARQFLDHFSAQVTAFLRQAIPPGLDVSRSATIDPVARLAAFNSSVRPHLSTESEQYRFGLFNLLSAPFVVLPFSGTAHTPGNASPAAVSVFAEKVHAVSGLAVDDSSRDLIRRSTGVASAYQSLLVATGLTKDTRPERLHLLAQDFATASEAIAGTGKWAPLVSRLSGLSSQAHASDQLLSGKRAAEVREGVAAAQSNLARARSQLATAPEIGYMLTAIDQELAANRILSWMTTIVEVSSMVPPHPLAYLERLTQVMDWLFQHTAADWSQLFGSMRVREEVFARAGQLRVAQAGRGSVRLLVTADGVLVPFWVVELPYTFETGVLWAKKGKEVPEILLVAATFPTDLSSLDGLGASRALTDVFAAARGGPQLNQVYSRLSGKEASISDSGALWSTLQSAAAVPVTGRQAAPPFTTGSEALKLVQAYLNVVRAANPKVAAQLRASSPRIVDLVYIPCAVPGPVPLPWLGPLSPVSLGDPQAILGLAT